MVSSSASSSTPSSPHSRMSSPSRETLDGITSSLEAARTALSVVHAHEGVRALIPTKTRTYLAPGGDYSFLNFTHEYGCRNALAPEFDELVRRAVISVRYGAGRGGFSVFCPALDTAQGQFYVSSPRPTSAGPRPGRGAGRGGFFPRLL